MRRLVISLLFMFTSAHKRHWPGSHSKTHQVKGFRSNFLYNRWYRCHVNIQGFYPYQETVPRVNTAGMAPEDFFQQFDLPSQPVVLEGLAKDWPGKLAGSLNLAGLLSRKQAPIFIQLPKSISLCCLLYLSVLYSCYTVDRHVGQICNL